MNKVLLIIKLILVTAIFNFGAVSFAHDVKPVDPSKVERKYDKRDLKFYKKLKNKTVKIKDQQTKKKHRLENKITRKSNKKLDDTTRLAHLKERLELAKNDPKELKRLNKAIANTEARIAKREAKLKELGDKHNAAKDNLLATETDLAKIQVAIDQKKAELENKVAGSEGTGTL